VRILIADDHAVVRHGVREILAQAFPSAQFGEASDGDEVLRQVWSREWDIVVLDMIMPGKCGLDILRHLKAAHPRLRVLILSMYPEDQLARRALKAGASGYLNKESAAEELVEAVKKTCSGGKYLSRSLAEKLAFDLVAGADGPPHERLSDREFQVMCMIASGMTVSQIARSLSLSVKTVSTYRARALEKMNMKTNSQLTRYALQNGLVD